MIRKFEDLALEYQSLFINKAYKEIVYNIYIFNTMTDTNNYKSISYVTKSKYILVSEKLKSIINDDLKHKEFMNAFKDIFKFDPNKIMSNPDQANKKRIKRDKLKEEGISTYISSGAKKSYEKKKNAAAVANDSQT